MLHRVLLKVCFLIVLLEVINAGDLLDLEFVDRREPLAIPEGWKLVGPAPRDEIVRLIFAIKPRNVDQFFKIFWSVTDPKSTHYGQYMSIEDYTELLSPDEETISNLLSWLDSHNIKPSFITANRDFVHAEVTVETAEMILSTSYWEFNHKRTDTTVHRSLGPYRVPSRIAKTLDFISGSLGLPRMLHQNNVSKKRSSVPANPSIIHERYNITKTEIGGNKLNKQSVAEFTTNYYNPSDLQSFFEEFWPGKNYSSTVERVIGPNKPEFASLQASVDVQYIMGVAPNIGTWFWTNPGTDFWGDLSSWVNQLASTELIPEVHAVTYGNEGEGPSQEYRDRLSLEFAKLGARGISILVAAGDSGTGCYLCYYYEPTFPATSPYVTVVGATRFLESKIGPEAAPEEFSTGGGFAWNFEQPPYQTTVVTHYFATVKSLPDPHFYNAYGRGMPDVSCLGTGYLGIVSGNQKEVYGTGPATVTFAAMVSLMNEIRVDHLLTTLGFLNPWLYTISQSYPKTFFDVTVGNNRYGCCGFSGFVAAPGWDPVSGLGTPNYEFLRTLVERKQPI